MSAFASVLTRVFVAISWSVGRRRSDYTEVRRIRFPPHTMDVREYCQAAFRLRDDRSANRAAIFMRLLASTAAATHSSKRSRPSARQRFLLRQRDNTEMRPSM